MSAPSDQPYAAPAASGVSPSLSPALRVMEFVNSRINFERLPVEQYGLQDFKLGRMQELLARLGDPQQSLPAIHIAGTKGKGSTAAMTAAILSAAGHRVGLFTSPHLNSLGERMTVDGLPPTEDHLHELLDIVPPVVREMDKLGPAMRPTFFECITAMAWVHFLRQRADLVVLEVGLGGRLDATNVCSPLVTVITSISRDHERLLGHTLGEIAAEKAGIIKPGVPVLSGARQPGPRDVVRETAARNDAPLFELVRDLRWSVAEPPSSVGSRKPEQGGPIPSGIEPMAIQVETPWSKRTVRVPLPGRHQARNAVLALSACDLLATSHFSVSDDAINRRWEQLQWPLRIEVIRHRPLVVVDAAHNDDSVDCLIETLGPVPCRRRLLVFATSKDKDTAGLLSRLNGHFDEVILTQYIGNPRSVPADVLRAIAARTLTIPHRTAATPSQAWQLARDGADDDDLICATGSFFLAAEMRDVILADDDGESDGDTRNSSARPIPDVQRPV